MKEEIVKKRLEILSFNTKHGNKATVDAFKVSVRTVERWRKKLKESKGKIHVLSPLSTKPKNLRLRKLDLNVLEEIIKLRKEHPKLGKRKIGPLLKKKLNIVITVSTIGRILKDLKNRGLIPSYYKTSLYGRTGIVRLRQRKFKQKLRKKKGERVFQVDTVIRHFNGVKLYTLTGIDTETRQAFAKGYFSHSSLKAREFIEDCKSKIDIPKVQTDNGSEFNKEFSNYLQREDITQYFIYPRCPNMNAHVERFNRTLDEEFLKFNQYKAILSLEEFNKSLQEYIDWYNIDRPHASLNFLSPVEYVLQLESDKC
jgi:transposase